MAISSACAIRTAPSLWGQSREKILCGSCRDRILGPVGHETVVFARLDEKPQLVVSVFEGLVEFVHSFGFVGHLARLEIGNNLQAKVRGAADPVGHKQGIHFTFVSAVELVFPKFLNDDRCSAEIIHSLSELIE